MSFSFCYLLRWPFRVFDILSVREPFDSVLLPAMYHLFLIKHSCPLCASIKYECWHFGFPTQQDDFFFLSLLLFVIYEAFRRFNSGRNPEEKDNFPSRNKENHKPTEPSLDEKVAPSKASQTTGKGRTKGAMGSWIPAVHLLMLRLGVGNIFTFNNNAFKASSPNNFCCITYLTAGKVTSQIHSSLTYWKEQ